MSFLFRGLATLAILMYLTAYANAQVCYSGEELFYKVTYMGVNLGSIRSEVEQSLRLDGRLVHKVKIHIVSNPNIPFVSLHSIYESWIDTSVTHSHQFNANTKITDSEWEFDKYIFDYSGRQIITEKWRGDRKLNSQVFKTSKKYNDGSSLLFAARQLVYAKKSYRIPTLIMDDTVSTIINFQGTIESQKVSAVDYPIRTIYFNGDANWTGVYGLTGRFEGWFSDDEARIPIRAKMKVYVGSVNLELVSWKRGSWQPPRFN